MTSRGTHDPYNVDPQLAQFRGMLERALQLPTEAGASARMSEIAGLCGVARKLAAGLADDR
jgi:hypothetical protein